MKNVCSTQIDSGEMLKKRAMNEWVKVRLIVNANGPGKYLFGKVDSTSVKVRVPAFKTSVGDTLLISGVVKRSFDTTLHNTFLEAHVITNKSVVYQKRYCTKYTGNSLLDMDQKNLDQYRKYNQKTGPLFTIGGIVSTTASAIGLMTLYTKNYKSDGMYILQYLPLRMLCWGGLGSGIYFTIVGTRNRDRYKQAPQLKEKHRNKPSVMLHLSPTPQLRGIDLGFSFGF